MESLDRTLELPINLTPNSVSEFHSPTYLAAEILKEIMQFRRTIANHQTCEGGSCSLCLSPHLPNVVSAIAQRRPITFVLPAFPGKSPNPAKVLGPLPDMAEKRALQFLNSLCERVKKRYAPGARVILCSDGRVFSDIIGMKESNVTAYQSEVTRLVGELGLNNLSTYTLDEMCEGENFVQMRVQLMDRYGQSLEFLQDKVRKGAKTSASREEEEANRIYCGITRFLVEDSMHPGQTKSKTAIQKECRVRAYEVILRSNAWSELIAERFPLAVRLSIHPQTCGARKLGIQLLGTESWMTPWHGVAVDTGNEFVLMKRHEAEKLGAELQMDADGRASHYRLVPN